MGGNLVNAAADLLLLNGRIWTGSEHDPSTPGEVSALAVRGGKVLAIGADPELAEFAPRAERVIDLQGRRVVPGLIDSHIHAVRAGLTWGLSLHWEDLRSLEAGLDQIRERARNAGKGEWISVTGGWHSRQLREPRLPRRSELDAVAPDNPVYVQELYDHGVLNTAGLALCGWEDSSPDPVGGVLLHDELGRLTGQITGMGAFARPLALALTPSATQAIDGTRQMLREFATHGLTTVVDGGGLTITPADYASLYQLWRDDDLAVRARLFMSAWTRGGEVENVRQLTELVHPGFGDGRLQVVGVGEIPHLGCHDLEGLDAFVIAAEAFAELVEITRLCVAAGWRMSVHAVLNDSLTRVLDAWEIVQAETGAIVGEHFSIVHADGASDANIARIAALGAGVMVQNRMMLKATDYIETWGAPSVRSAPPLGRMRAHGVLIGGGTDATRANWYSPWASIGWLVTGESVDGATPRAVEHRLTVAQALAAFTRDAAWFTGEEGERGRLVAGFDADICVPSLDPFTCAPAELASIRSDLTLLGGEVTHAAGAFSELAQPAP